MTTELQVCLAGSPLACLNIRDGITLEMNRAHAVSIFSRARAISRSTLVSLALLCLLASPAPSAAQDAGVSGIPPGPANARGLNGSVNDPSGIGNAAKIPALPQPRIAPVPVPTLAPSAGGYRSFSPAASYRTLRVRRAAKGKRTRHAATRSRRAPARANVSDEDQQIDRKLIGICRGC